MSQPFIIDYLFQLRWSICFAGIFSLIVLWAVKPKSEIKYLWIILLVGIFTQSRFGTLHNSFFLHDHDCIHYQLGSKYFKEFGYNGMYAGLALALKELNAENPKIDAPKKFRDLDNKTGEHLDASHPKTQRVREKFTEQRWELLKKDILDWEEKHTPDWSHIVKDAGYNPPPAWTIWGLLINKVITPKNSFLYGIPDMIILFGIFYLLWTTFNPRTALYTFSVMMFFPGGPYAPFDWVGGSLFRYLWFFWISLGLIAYYKKQYKLAGAALALAAMERIFPGAWLASAGLVAAFHLVQNWREHKWESIKPLKDLVVGSTITICTVLILTHLVMGIETWGDFIKHIKEHGSYLFTNHIGWTRAITFHPNMGPMGFSAENMSIFNDWNEILLDRKNWLIYILLRLSFIGAMVVWAWQNVKKDQETLSIAWMGAGVVFFASMPAHYYLLGLLPIVGITAAQSPRMFLGLLITVAIITALTQMTETLGWALASITMVGAAAYGLGYSLASSKKSLTATTCCGIVIFILAILPSLYSDPVREHNKATITRDNSVRFITRSFLIKEGYEVRDNGYILSPNQRLSVKTPTASNHNINIRTDRYYKGTLVLMDSNNNIIHTWDVKARGSMFDTLTYGPLPPTRDFIIEWRGEDKTDIGIFSIWTLPLGS